MTRRIFRSIFFVAFCVILACILIITSVLYRSFNDLQRDELKVQTGLAAQGVAGEGLSYLEALRPDG